MTAKKTLSIATWNVNSVRFRIDIIERFLREVQPSVLCLQETKVVNDDFPAGVFRQQGYNHQLINGQPKHHGVAIVSKIPIRESHCHDWQNNGEARHIGGLLDCGLRLENVYVPAGGEKPDLDTNPKFVQKLDFIARMTEWANKLDAPTLLVGDFNIAPLPSDVWNHQQLLSVVSHSEIEIQALAKFKAAHNWVDLGREFIKDPERLYTWWSYRASDWRASDRGRRLDHMWASPELATKALSHDIFEDCRNWGKPSDHIPIMTSFAL